MKRDVIIVEMNVTERKYNDGKVGFFILEWLRYNQL